MKIIENAKKVIELFKKYNDIELYRKIVEPEIQTPDVFSVKGKLVEMVEAEEGWMMPRLETDKGKGK